jgi:NAD(P)H-quinone oxidoreductase subunit I
VAGLKFEHYGRGMAKGMALTFKHLLRHPITTQYPEQKLNVSRRFRGYELVWYEDKCTGCATCAKSCPQGNIEIVTVQEGDRYKVLKFEVDTGRCMACGLCVEACPYQALYMGRGYERARYRRREVVLTKEDLKPSPERQPSGYANPEVEEQLPEQTLLVYRK